MTKSNTTVIYPGTFDPITNGHLDLITRAANLFTNVIVAVADNAKKSTFCNYQQRLDLVRKVVKKHDNIEVCEFSGLLVDFARERNCFVVLRGLRAISDFEYEFQLAGMNKKMEPRLETVFLTASEQYSYLSSSLVREISSLGGDVSAFVPEEVLEVFPAVSKSYR